VHDGYKGRVGIYQVMPVTETIGRIIMEGGNAMQIADAVRKGRGLGLRRSGLQKVKAGVQVLKKSTALQSSPDVGAPSRDCAVGAPSGCWSAFRRDCSVDGSGSRLKALRMDELESWLQASINQVGFTWEGTDNRGNKVRGKTSWPPDEAAVRAVLRKQGVVPVRIRKESSLFKAAARSSPATSPSSAASLPPCWQPAFRWCRPSISSAPDTTTRRCRN
jgi:hypothetical protein